MFKHVVCFKLKDNSREHCEKIKAMMLKMKDNIEYIKDIEVGIDTLHSARSYDIILSIVLDKAEDLNKYSDHPYHVENVKSYMAQARTDSIAVDFEM